MSDDYDMAATIAGALLMVALLWLIMYGVFAL